MGLDRATQIAAARRYAPPLWTAEKLDRRGASLRGVSPRAVGYATRAGFGLDEVYPGSMYRIRAMAPPGGTVEAAAFARSVGLPLGAIYPPADFGGERGGGVSRRGAGVAHARHRKGPAARLLLSLAGVIGGSLILGPAGAAIGAAWAAHAGGR